MPRRKPSYRHYKPKNLGLVVIDGKQIYLGEYGTAESLARYDRLTRDLPAPAPTTPNDDPGRGGPIVNEVILAFWDHAEKHYRYPRGSLPGS